MGLLKFILYAIVIYYCIKFLSRLFVSFFLKRLANKMTENIKKKTNSYSEQKKGETVVQYKKDDNIDPGGEYVDFEDLSHE
tara:strand:- start:2141 stop:2383 length:243 start_codon:yes stop_codon:yes gene_type:complete